MYKVTYSLLLLIFPLYGFGPFTINFRVQEFSFLKEMGGDSVVYDRLLPSSSDYSLCSGEPGSPELPLRPFTYIIPPLYKVDSIQVELQYYEPIEGLYLIYPIQPPRTFDSVVS